MTRPKGEAPKTELLPKERDSLSEDVVFPARRSRGEAPKIELLRKERDVHPKRVAFPAQDPTGEAPKTKLLPKERAAFPVSPEVHMTEERTGAESSEKEPNPITIPVNVKIDVKEVVLSQPEMEELLQAAELIALGDCYCRKTHGNCDRPVHVCLTLDATAEKYLKEGGWRPVEVSEALEVLKETHRAGLVHLAFRNSDHQTTSVCSCCSCCCEALGELTAQTYKTGVVTSAYVATFDADSCVACGTCIDRCQFAAFSRDSEDNTIAFNTDQCLGCGLCVSTCPVGAIGFVER